MRDGSAVTRTTGVHLRSKTRASSRRRDNCRPRRAALDCAFSTQPAFETRRCVATSQRSDTRPYRKHGATPSDSSARRSRGPVPARPRCARARQPSTEGSPPGQAPSAAGGAAGAAGRAAMHEDCGAGAGLGGRGSNGGRAGIRRCTSGLSAPSGRAGIWRRCVARRKCYRRAVGGLGVRRGQGSRVPADGAPSPRLRHLAGNREAGRLWSARCRPTVLRERPSAAGANSWPRAPRSPAPPSSFQG
jgi:hypothetical protein